MPEGENRFEPAVKAIKGQLDTVAARNQATRDIYQAQLDKQTAASEGELETARTAGQAKVNDTVQGVLERMKSRRLTPPSPKKTP